jgi:hypothetical protein
VECVAWDRQQASEANTRSFLVGTSTGHIYELAFDSSGKEKICQQVYQLEKPQPITALHVESFASTTAQDALPSAGIPATHSGSLLNSGSAAAVDPALSKIFVMCATPSPNRLYLFLGGPGFTNLFSSTGSGSSPSFTELPGSVTRTDLHCFAKPQHNRAQSFALTTKLGIFHGNLLLSSTQIRSDI